jgi:hypothetical protein
MAFKVRKTEHCGPKRGRGHWGTKAEAKHESSRKRRRQWKTRKDQEE